jgi:hypothetical protein
LKSGEIIVIYFLSLLEVTTELFELGMSKMVTYRQKMCITSSLCTNCLSKIVNMATMRNTEFASN